MEKISTLSEIRKIFQNKKIVQFLDDAYNLSKSKKTKDVYRHVLYSFNKFCYASYGKDLLNTMDELYDKPLENTLDMFLEYKRYLDSYTTQRHLPVSNGTKRVHMSVLKNFFRSCGIKVHHEDIQDHVKIGRKTRVRKFALDVETVTRIIETLDQFSFKTLTVLLASTGMRVMEAITLQLSDFDFKSYPVSVNIRAGETKTNEGRSVYLTKECASMMEQLIRSKPVSQPYLFGKSSEPINTYRKYSHAIRQSLHKIGLYKVLENGVNQITVHSFRSFFRTYAGHLVDRDFAESFIGHRFYLSEYQNMPEKEKKNQFLKLEPHLTFSHVELKTHALNPEIIELQEQVSDLQNKIRMLGNKFLVAKA
jgi:integrase